MNEDWKRLTEIATTRDANDMEFKAAVKNHAAAKIELKRKQDNAERQRKFQKNHYQRLMQVCEKDGSYRKILHIHETIGAIESQPGLLEAIVSLSMCGAGANERRADSLNSCRTLDDLTRELKVFGFNFS